MPGICYTRLNFFIKGGKVTTPTIMGDIFPPCDVKNTLIKHLFEPCPLVRSVYTIVHPANDDKS